MLRVWSFPRTGGGTGEPGAPLSAHPPDRPAAARGALPARVGAAPARLRGRVRPGRWSRGPGPRAGAAGPAGLGAAGRPGRDGRGLPGRLRLPGGAVLVGHGGVLGLLVVGGLAPVPPDAAAADPAAGGHGPGVGPDPVRPVLRRRPGGAGDPPVARRPERGRPDPDDRPGHGGRPGDRPWDLAERGGAVAGGGVRPP